MSRPDQNIESRLRTIDQRWRFLRLLQHAATFASVILGLVILLAIALSLGWITTPGVASALVALLVASGLLGSMLLLMIVLGKNLPRNQVAHALERAHPKLLDRLNTLLFLQQSPPPPDAAAFYPEIANQTSAVLKEPPASGTIAVGRPLLHLACCALLLGLAIWVIDRFTPWQRLMENHRAELAAASLNAPQDPPPELLLPPPETSATEQSKPWGEVRITEPARDLKLTKVDVLPIEIEAAASAPLEKIAWSTSINGAQETAHPLPQPSEPRYAVYQPEVYLDEFQLSDWDVLSYYAWTTTDTGARYASDIYFAEIRPFREDILNLPGGTEGEAYQTLRELTSLVERQQHILRETHRHLQQPPLDSRLAQQEVKKLADAERDLRQAIDHLYARMASEMENKPIGEALDHLATASQHAEKATDALLNDQADQAQPQEHHSLAQLLSARKSFQRAVSENPGRFEESSGETPPPLAGTEDQLKSMAEFRNESKAASQFLRSAVEKQQALADETARSSTRNYPKIARSQNDLNRSVQDFQNQHPRLFNDLQAEADQAQETMNQAAQSLTQRKTAARGKTAEAVEQLQQLEQKIQQQHNEEQLADAYRLKRMLDQQIEQLGQCQSAPGTFSNSELRRTAGQSRQTVEQLGQLAQDPISGQAFSQPLREALTPQARQSINQSLSQLERAQSDPQKAQAAEQAQQALSNVSQAFEQSQPQALQSSRQSDPLAPGSPEEQFAQGMERLQQLVQQLQNPKQRISKTNQAKLGQEALLNLQNGLPDDEGSNQSSRILLSKLEDALDPTDRPLDPIQLQQLLDKLRRFSQELIAEQTDPNAPADLSNIDPARLPPAYRSQIQNYFKKLSER